MIEVVPQPLTAEAFQPFGVVIEADPAKSFLINDGTTQRFDKLASVEVGEEGQAAISIFRASRWPQPIEIRMFERHPLGSQSFFPLSPHPWLVVVADGEAPSSETCRAFLARGDQGVQLAAGTWHHPLLVLEAMQDFLVVDRTGPGENLEECALAGPPCRIALP